MSPTDRVSFNHDLFKQYVDPLSIKPGVDHPMAIGTEMRYFGVRHAFTSSPKEFKNALECQRKRRFLLLGLDFDFKLLIRNLIRIFTYLFLKMQILNTLARKWLKKIRR